MKNKKGKFTKGQQKLTSQDVLYCQTVVAGKNDKDAFFEIYADTLTDNDNTNRIKLQRHKKRKKIIEHIAKLQKITNEFMLDCVKKNFDEIHYKRKNAFEDLEKLKERSIDSKNYGVAVKSVEAIIKLLGLAEVQTDQQITFKIHGLNNNKTSS